MAAPELGILVLGYARPQLLGTVLESLSRQAALTRTHVWIDGTADRSELSPRSAECGEIARKYAVAEVRAHRGHLGIEKLMLDALAEMMVSYDRLLVLEDDCFPNRRAVQAFSDQLDVIARDASVFSLYGHHFLTAGEGDRITRFQGWGWATTRSKLEPILRQARELFLLPEHRYLEYTRRALTPDIVAKLDITANRNVCQVLNRFFSWDSCTALLTALAGQYHQRTRDRVIFNCGIGPETGHFAGGDYLRLPPFNMIRPDEVWDHF